MTFQSQYRAAFATQPPARHAETLPPAPERTGAAPPLRDRLASDGFVVLQPDDLGAPDFCAQAIAGLLAAADDLPLDPYCRGAFRFRRFARLYLLPWSDTIVLAPPMRNARGEPVQMYHQPEALNTEEAGISRWFPALDDSIAMADWMQHIIRFDFRQLSFSEAERSAPVQIGVHIVELRAGRDAPAVASPNRVHRDGEPYTCAHLIERRGVTGGENHIVDPGWAEHQIESVPDEAIRAAFTLQAPLDGYIVRDDRVAHHVGAVHLDPAAEKGSRTILLIDFTPMRPAMLMDPVTG